MRIGIIGAGMIGSTKLWLEAGYEIRLASRHPENLRPLVEQLGKRASAGTPADAATFGDVVMLTVPLVAIRELSGELATSLVGKIFVPSGDHAGLPAPGLKASLERVWRDRSRIQISPRLKSTNARRFSSGERPAVRQLPGGPTGSNSRPVRSARTNQSKDFVNAEANARRKLHGGCRHYTGTGDRALCR